MSYDDLRDRLDDLESGDDRRIVSFPDGSIDRWYALTGRGGDRLETADGFAAQLADGGRSFSLEPLEERPGGQAVNAAVQVHALGDAATLVGHLDHPVLSEVPVETRSMGEPRTVRVVAFAADELLFAEPGPADGWGVEDLLAVVDWERVVGADALCCANWVSFRGLESVFERLASDPPEKRHPVVVDPGPIDTVDPAALEGLFDGLSNADSAAPATEIVLSVNPAELDAAAAVVGSGAGVAGGTGNGPADRDRDRDRDRVAALRSALDITGVVCHGPDAAVGATRDETRSLGMVSVGEPQRTTGAGDRFSGGLACGVVRDWPLETALALGNACAARFVGTGVTADPAAVRSVLEPEP
ncbi:PfkB family carbohydrate kinase [Natrinema salaciae]|uniref:Sugar or nucleoside kinase, ribokinase family n=1 Tax=Natrinema salaciae TaxID=1186196 RepID=A0A1H9Q9Q4_9EURY|nr:PfkB family carbohydrate kinase [Natrinema salaciae]SER57132.1 Sugar or nucleoside kinase, ribokinase family [Natrinema salaciae]